MHKISIKYKIAGLLIVIIFISNVFLGVLNFNNSKSIASEIIINNNESELKNINDYYFDKLIHDMEYIVTTWADSEYIRTYEKQINTPRIVRSIPNDFNHVYDQWIGLTQSMEDITWFYYALESDGSIFIAPVDESMPDSYDARTRDWYKGTISQKGNIYWTEPYVDAGDSGKILQTVSKAVYDNGILKGVVALDIELGKFTEIIQELSFAKSSSIFLINQSNQIIAHNSDDVDFYKETFIDTLTNESVSTFTAINGDDYVSSWTPLKINDWKLVAVTKTTFKDELALMKKQTVLIVCITVLISFIFSYFGFRNILTQLHKLVKNTEEYAKGNFKTRCNIDSNDEFKILAISMNNMLDSIQSLIDERDENYIKTVKVLANAIEASDEYTRGHCDRVGEISNDIGRYMGLDSEALMQLEFACILHDIGKIAIPERILNKKGHLTDEEYLLVKRHPSIGYDIVKDIQFLENANRAILQHHERVDGNGYPYGLINDEICLEAKIIAVADAYDAMTSQRVYRKNTLSVEEATQELIRCSGQQFDPNVVDAFVVISEFNPQPCCRNAGNEYIIFHLITKKQS